MAPPRPIDYVAPPAPSPLDVARTLRTVATDLVPLFLRLARRGGSTTTEPGLASVRIAFERALRHLGVALTVRRAGVVPRQGGLVLMWNQLKESGARDANGSSVDPATS